MIKSMTGFGRSSLETPWGPIQVEVKTVNHKYLDLSSKLPPPLFAFEERIRKLVQDRVARGKIYLNVACPDSAFKARKIHVDDVLAREYYNAARHLARSLGSKETLGLKALMQMPDVMTRVSTAHDVEVWWSKVAKAIVIALKKMEVSRYAEGRVLAADLKKRAGLIIRSVQAIRKRSPRVVEEHKLKAAKRAKAQGERAGDDKTQQEIAAFARACDITEELVRLDGHLSSLKKTLASTDEAGRKLDFIAQEIMRETNTIGAKANDFFIQDKVVGIKAELEKIREQALNVE